jgi:periplasmic protein TonB
MIALAAERRDLQRWFVSGAAVLLAHAALMTALLQWREPVEPAEPASAIMIELAPMPVAPEVTRNDVAPGPEQVRADTPPEKAVETPEETTNTIQQAPHPEVMLVPPKPTPAPPTPKETHQPVPTASAPQTAPVRRSAVAAAPAQAAPSGNPSQSLSSWKTQVVGLIERNKRYPAEAQARHEQGEAQLAFSIDRQGRVVSSRIARSSGSSALDQEALALPRRAQPFPPPPPELRGAQISLSVPIQFHIR